MDIFCYFKDNLPNDLKFFLKIMKILITKSNLTLIPKETTDQHLNDLSRKRKAVDSNLNHCLATGRSQTDPIRI